MTNRAAGNTALNALPAPGVESIASRARWLSNACLTIAVPGPVPPVCAGRHRMRRGIEVKVIEFDGVAAMLRRTPAQHGTDAGSPGDGFAEERRTYFFTSGQALFASGWNASAAGMVARSL